MSAGTPSGAISSSVATKKVSGRRQLRFESLGQAVAEARRLAEVERAGNLAHSGNWTLGQAMGHVATWADYSFEGAPLHPPLLIKLILRVVKRRFLNNPMRPGVKIPKVENGTLATNIVPLEEGLAHLERAFERLNAECPAKPNVIFGRMTHDQWIKLNCRHAELHLSFFRPRD